MANQSNKHWLPAFDIVRLEKIQYGIEFIELSGAGELVDERGVRRVVVVVALFVEVFENWEEFVGVFALFEMLEEGDRGFALNSGEFVRAWLLFGFVANIAMKKIGLNTSE